MGDFSRDLGEAFRAASGICEFLLERHPAREGILPLYLWQGEVFGRFDEDALNGIEEHLEELGAKNARMADVVALIKSETTAVRKFLDWILEQWRNWKLGDLWEKTKQRAAAVLGRQSRKGMEVLKTLLESLIDLLKGLAPHLAALLDLAKEAVKHLRE